MAVTRVQHVIGTTNTNATFSLTIAAVAAGNVGCGFIYGNNVLGTGFTVSDTNNSYTVVTGTFGNDTTDGQGLWPFYLVGVVAGTTTLTITHASDNISACFVEYHSTTGWTGFRNAAAGANNTSSATLACATSLGAAGDTIISACWDNSDTAVTVHDGVLTLLDTTTSPTIGTIAGDADILSASGAVTPSYTIDTNITGTGMIAALAFTPSGAIPDAFGSRIFRLQYNPWR